MLKLNKATMEQRATLMEKLAESWVDMDDAAVIYNEALIAAFEAFRKHVDAYNEVVAEANDWIEEQAGAMDEYMGERSEKWAESPKGEQYETWKTAYETTQLEMVEIEAPTPFDLTSDDQAYMLDELPPSADEA